MIKHTEAWKTSNGQCYTDKKIAYSEEVKYLLMSLPKGMDRKPLASVLKKLLDEVKQWLLTADEFRQVVHRTPADEKLLIVKEFKRLIDDIEEWIEQSNSLLSQMSNEANVEVKRSIAEQGG